LIKYCVFVQIFEHIHREEIKLEHMKEHFTKFTILKDKNIIKHFNSKFLKRIL
jgi:glutathione peroxidase-family protein